MVYPGGTGLRDRCPNPAYGLEDRMPYPGGTGLTRLIVYPGGTGLPALITYPGGLPDLGEYSGGLGLAGRIMYTARGPGCPAAYSAPGSESTLMSSGSRAAGPEPITYPDRSAILAS